MKKGVREVEEKRNSFEGEEEGKEDMKRDGEE